MSAFQQHRPGLVGIDQAVEISFGHLLTGAGGLDIESPQTQHPQQGALSQYQVRNAFEGDCLSLQENDTLFDMQGAAFEAILQGLGLFACQPGADRKTVENTQNNPEAEQT